MKAITRFVLRRAGILALVGITLAVLGGYYTVQLYKNLRTDVEELLPTTARSVVDMSSVTHRLESIDNLAILIFSEHPDQSRKFVDDLAGRLKQGPKELVASVEYRIDKELKFFKDRRALYMDLADLIKVRDYIEGRIDYEKQIRNPLNIFTHPNIPEPRLNFKAMESKYEKKISGYSRFPDGYYATPDQTKRVILVYIAGKSAGTAQTTALKKFVTETIAGLRPQSYDPGMQIKYTGGVENMLEEQAALVRDLELSTIIVTIVVALAMLIFFRAFRATVALVLSLSIGTLWTFGIAYFAVGYLNANSAFLGSIVIGNGINFGIIYLARYMEERRNGRRHVRATYIAMTHTATATWTAALAAGLSYGSLILTGFRGFKQFGVIGLIGMLLCWVSAFTMLPVLLGVLDRLRPIIPAGKPKPKSYLTEGLAHVINARPGLIWAASFGLTIVSLFMLTRFTPDILETNLSNLRSKESTTRGSAFLSKYVDEIFQRYLSPMAVLPSDRDDARKIATLLRHIKERQERQGGSSLISSVQTLDDFVPPDQSEKIVVLKEIKELLPPRLLRRLGPEETRIFHEFLNDTVMKPIQVGELPQLVLSKFTEKDGNVGRLVLVEPPLNNTTWEGANLVRFIRGLRGAADAIAPGTPVAGHLPISSDMIESIMRDGPRATFFAFLAVVTLVIILFRNRKTIVLILFALLLGVNWLSGIILAFNVKINFLNFIALPITFGIGVDYGVNIFQRYREEGSGSIIKVIRDTGGAVMLCSFTTIVGYCSLLIAENRAFVSFGLLAVLGELTCIVAAIISLPAYLLVRDRRRRNNFP